MERMCYILRVKPELMDEYREAHDNIWPELLEAMREAGQHNYSLFMTDDGLAIGYFEAEDMAASIKRLEATDVSQRWEQSMARFFEAGLSDFGSGNLVVPEQIFYAS